MIEPLETPLEPQSELRDLLEAAPDAMVVVNDAGTIVLTNSQAELLFQYQPGELEGQQIEVLVPERHRHRHDGHRHGYGRNPRTRRMGSGLELHGRRSDGSEFPVEISLSPIETERGTLVCSAIRDISDRKLVEDELRGLREAAEADRARLAEAQRLAHVGSFEIDLVTGERWWSDEYWRLLGLDKALSPSRELLLSTIHADDLAETQAIWQRVDGGESVDGVTFRIVRPTGEVRWTRSRMRVEADEHGKPVKIVGTTMDVTKLHDAMARQREAEINFSLSFEHSHVGLAMADLDGRLTRINSAVCSILARSESEILGKRMLDFVSPGERGDEDLMARLISNHGRNRTCSATTERALVTPHGDVVWAQETISLVRNEQGEPSHFFLQLQDVSDRKQAEDALIHQATHDPLTGLGNRAFLSEKIDQVLAHRTADRVSVLFVDVNKFKVINDARGHAAGDALLVQIADRLRSAVRPTDTLARFGGDEFVIVCEDITPENAERLAGRIVDATRAPFDLEGQQVYVTLSVGVVMAEAGDDAETLLRKSDVAMYQAKERDRTHVAVFDHQMQALASSRLETESQLGGALERDELRLVYQPIVDVHTEKTIGFEALVRWQHPSRGLLAPAEFMSIAEETGMILAIGEWVLREALMQLQLWRMDVPGARDLFVAVNLSARQVQDPEFPAAVARTLAQTRVEPTALHLELTESMVMSRSDVAVQNVTALRELGVRVSLDDFGTGYSSLSYLHQIPAHTVKIDRSFVAAIGEDNASATSIIGAIVGLGRALELDVVGEGVETPQQVEELRRLGVRYAQGYLWSPPIAPAVAQEWIREKAARNSPSV
ncbi:sensor domain-containing protein [Ruicaihuangia caeni]|uniref:sensor domain-containing protein n=1 Tax=Ruicaihuangia caeni TaxID=3042517 RepID=UPI00338DFCBE